MNLDAEFRAYIPPEPPGLEIVKDANDKVWVRMEEGWASPGLIGFRTWKRLVVDLGPLRAVSWAIPSDLGQEGE